MPANPSVTAQFPSNVRKAEAKHLAGLVCAFRFHADGTPDELNVDRPIADGDGWLWLHFNLADAPRLPLPGCGHACSAAGADAARLRRRPSATARQRRLSLRHPCRPCLWLSGATEEIGFLHFALTESVFISSRRHQLNAVETTRKELRRGLKVQSPSALLEVIAGQMIESLDRFTDGLADQLDHAEERILADELSVDRQLVGSIRRLTVRLHRQLVTLRSLIHRFEHDIELFANPALSLPTQKLGQRLDCPPAAGGDHAEEFRTDQPQSASAHDCDHRLPARDPGSRYFRSERRGIAAGE